MFAIITFFYENVLYQDTLKRIRHLLPEMAYPVTRGFPAKIGRLVKDIILAMGGPLYKIIQLKI